LYLWFGDGGVHEKTPPPFPRGIIFYILPFIIVLFGAKKNQNGRRQRDKTRGRVFALSSAARPPAI